MDCPDFIEPHPHHSHPHPPNTHRKKWLLEKFSSLMNTHTQTHTYACTHTHWRAYMGIFHAHELRMKKRANLFFVWLAKAVEEKPESTFYYFFILTSSHTDRHVYRHVEICIRLETYMFSCDLLPSLYICTLCKYSHTYASLHDGCNNILVKSGRQEGEKLCNETLFSERQISTSSGS